MLLKISKEELFSTFFCENRGKSKKTLAMSQLNVDLTRSSFFTFFEKLHRSTGER